MKRLVFSIITCMFLMSHLIAQESSNRSNRLYFGRIVYSDFSGEEFIDGNNGTTNSALFFMINQIGYEYVIKDFVSFDLSILIREYEYDWYKKSYDKTVGISGNFALNGMLSAKIHPIKQKWFDPYIGAGVVYGTYFFDFDAGFNSPGTGYAINLGNNFFIGSKFYCGLNMNYINIPYKEYSSTNTTTSTTSGSNYPNTTTTTTSIYFPSFTLNELSLQINIGLAF